MYNTQCIVQNRQNKNNISTGLFIKFLVTVIVMGMISMSVPLAFIWSSSTKRRWYIIGKVFEINKTNGDSMNYLYL